MARRRPLSSSLTPQAATPLFFASSNPSSTPASTPLAIASTRASKAPGRSSTPDGKSPPPRAARRRAADLRRKSGLTIEQRMFRLCDRLLTMVRHYPLDGILLVEVYEELVDHTEGALRAGNGASLWLLLWGLPDLCNGLAALVDRVT